MKTVHSSNLYMKDGLVYYDGDLFTGIERFENATAFYKDGKFHREDGPAIIHGTGSVRWHLNGDAYFNINDWAKAVGIFDTDEFTMLKLKWG